MKILVAEDELIVRSLMEKVLTNDGHTVVCAEDGLIAQEHLNQENFDLMFADFQMPRLNGIDLARSARTLNPQMYVVIVTGHSTRQNAIDAIKVGVYDYIEKPFKNLDELSIIAQRLADKIKYESLCVDMDNKQFYEKLFRIVEENYTDKDFSVKDLYKHLGEQERTIQRKVKMLTDDTPVAFIFQHPAKKAMRELRSGQPKKQVFSRCGFESIKQMDRWVKRFYQYSDYG